MGGALGVAVFGSLLVSGYRSALDADSVHLGLTRAELASAKTSVARGLSLARELGGEDGRRVAHAARAAFVHGMGLSMTVGAAVSVLAAGFALRSLPARAREPFPAGVELVGVEEQDVPAVGVIPTGTTGE